MSIRILYLFCTLLFSTVATAQLPPTDIYLFDIVYKAGKADLANPKFLTSFHDGYNNQPYFKNANELYFTSNFRDSSSTDILKFDLRTRKLFFVTSENESDYSPKISPDRKKLCTVRVLEDQEQVIYRKGMKENTEDLLSEKLTNVGYYQWLNFKQLALFLVDSPNKLVLYNIFTEKQEHIDLDIGRSLETHRGELYYSTKDAAGNWQIKKFDPQLGDVEHVIKGLSEDFCISSSGIIWTTQGQNVYNFDLQKSTTWNKVGDMSVWDIQSVSRIQVFQNKLAIVSHAGN